MCIRCGHEWNRADSMDCPVCHSAGKRVEDALPRYGELRREEKESFTRSLLAKQGGKCALCGRPLDYKRTPGNQGPVIDHVHAPPPADVIRGVLHTQCNLALNYIENGVGPEWEKEPFDIWYPKAVQYTRQAARRFA